MIALQQSIVEVAIAGNTDMEVDVDHFAGFGGWAEGFRQATGHSPSIACNHDLHAITTHQLNHPDAIHFRDDVRLLCAQSTLAGRMIRWLHGSPDCTHHSKAKGSKPRRQDIRGLAWHLLPWVFHGRAKFMSLENVAEFLDWGPVDAKGKVIDSRKGETFRAFVACLSTGLAENDPTWPEILKEIGGRIPIEALARGLGYQVEHRKLCAADFGAPTSRTRLFLLARRAGQAIRWPVPTHGPGRKRAYRTAASCIDWSDPGRSIFGRKKPLVEATHKRIAHGTVRYVMTTADPFIVQTAHGDFANRPGARASSIHAPLGTITQSGDRAVVSPMLTKAHSHGWDRNGGPCMPANRLMPTITAKPGDALACCVLKAFKDVVGADIRRPLPTITTRDHNWLLAAHLSPFYSRSGGADLADPMPTITAQSASGHQAMSACVLAYYGSEVDGQAIDDPLRTITGTARFGLLNLELGGDLAKAVRVARFLLRYIPDAPVRWISIDGRLRPVALVIAKGDTYLITDLLFRMLKPMPELLLAQGFRRSYRCPGTQEQQTARIGNSVPPQFAKAIVAANLGPKPSLMGVA